MESIGGSYDGVFPMGLVGCLKPASHIYKYTRFFKRDVQNPLVLTVSVYDGHLKCEELCYPPNGNARVKSLASITHNRHYMAPGVQRIPVKYGKVRGCLFVPPGDGPFPGVVDMFGTAGGLLEYRSAQLASRGIASLALAFFAYDDLPKYLEEFDIAYFEEAVQFLLNHKKIMGPGVGVIGTSKGGDLALSMASFIPSIHACVTINCFNAVVNVGLRVKDKLYPELPFWPVDQIRILDGGIISVYSCELDPRRHPESTLPIEQSNACFLFMVGCNDKNINSEFYAQLAYKQLKEHNYPKHFEIASYPGAGHLLEPPFSPFCETSFQHTFFLPLLWGGSAKFHIAAQEQAWVKLINFLKHHLVDESINYSKAISSKL